MDSPTGSSPVGASPRQTGTSPRQSPRESPRMMSNSSQEHLLTGLRRLRKTVPQPSWDAAGLVSGTKFNGRSTPHKAGGLPPPDNKESVFISGRNLVPQRSVADHRALLQHGAAMLPHADENVLRKSLRSVEGSNQSSLAGGGSTVVAEARQHKPMKRVGANHPSEGFPTTARVFCIGESFEAHRPNSAMPNWAVAMHQAQSMEKKVDRPRTAPAGAARTQYQACCAGHADVINYRFSGGICPPDFKLDGHRIPSPTANATDSAGSKSAYWESRVAYSHNRVRSSLSFLG